MYWHLFFRVVGPFIIVLIALGVFVWGWIGRRIGSHPVCRNCGFNLTGRPVTSLRCAECGAELHHKKAICTGDRRRGVVRIGIALIVVTIAVIVVSKIDRNTWDDAYRELTPTWYMLIRARGSSLNSAWYIDQLVHRSEAGRLSSGESSSLARVLLNLPGGGMQWRWCKVVEDEYGNGHISDLTWEQFWEKNTSVFFKVRSLAHRDQPIPVRFFTLGCMFNIGSNPMYVWDTSCESFEINGLKWGPPGGVKMPSSREGWMLNNTQSISIPGDIAKQLHDGPTTITATISAYDPRDSRGRIHTTAKANLIFVPEDKPLYRYAIADDSARGAVRKAVKVSLDLSTSEGKSTVYARISSLGLPVDLYVRPYLIVDGIERMMDAPVLILGNKSQSNQSQYDPMLPLIVAVSRTNPSCKLSGEIPASADLILRPDPAGAARMVDLDEIWGEEIVFKDVPIK